MGTGYLIFKAFQIILKELTIILLNLKPEDLFVGLGNFFLQSLAYCMDFEDKVYILDYKVWIFYINLPIILLIFMNVTVTALS